MDGDVPLGFVRADLGTGFGADFGAIYIDRPGNRLGFRVEARHANAMGALHGGALATFADMQLMAIRPGPEEGRPHSPTINLSVDFVAPAKVGDWVEAKVSLVRMTRTMVFTQAIITVGGEPVSRTNAIYRNHEPMETSQ